MRFINNDLEIVNKNLKHNLEITNKIIENYQKEFLYYIITEKYKEQYIKKQNIINLVKSPFKKVRSVLQNILGESVEDVKLVELIDFSTLDEENKITKNIISEISYPDFIKYYNETNKYGLKKTNKKWLKLIFKM